VSADGKTVRFITYLQDEVKRCGFYGEIQIGTAVTEDQFFKTGLTALAFGNTD